MDDEILLAVPAVILLAAGAAATATGEVTLAQLAPGALAMSLFAVAMYGLARYRSPGDLDAAGDEAGPSELTGRTGTATVRDGAVPAVGTTDGGTDRPRAEPADTHGLDPVVRRAGEVRYDPVDAADGLRKGVLVGEADGARNLAIRRFALAPGASVPKHTNEIEHEQYVLAGNYTVGIDEEEYEVSAGDSLFIPAGAVHWYRNDGPDQGAFICAVPVGDDSIDLLDGE